MLPGGSSGTAPRRCRRGLRWRRRWDAGLRSRTSGARRRTSATTSCSGALPPPAPATTSLSLLRLGSAWFVRGLSAGRLRWAGWGIYRLRYVWATSVRAALEWNPTFPPLFVYFFSFFNLFCCLSFYSTRKLEFCIFSCEWWNNFRYLLLMNGCEIIIVS